MSTKRYLKQINQACNVYSLREVLNKCRQRIADPEIRNAMFARLEVLSGMATDSFDVNSLENLKEDIELATGHEYTTPLKKFHRLELEHADDLLGIFDASAEKDLLARVEKQLIFRALRDNDDNRTRAAKCLGVSIRTLRNKLNLYFGRAAASDNNYGKRSPYYKGDTGAEAQKLKH